MRIVVTGATGNVGRHVVDQALARDLEVVAVARDPRALDSGIPRLRVAAVDVLDAEGVQNVLEGADAVVSCVGIGTSRTPTTLCSQGTRNIVDGMARHGVGRLVVISSEVAEHWAHQGPVKLWIVLPLLQRFLGATYDDMRRMDIVLWESAARWTAIRAPRIRPVDPRGSYRSSTAGPLRRGWSITAPDMAAALLDIVERDDLDRRHVYVAN
ncbi:NAD(P)H-binding protein [Pseudoclavibacter chungangensis]|uniref:NAD(P)H-binding protein n=1 Tax=Pseudoclavibacter chungangensis TaxID=587635 RepID=A0A7J5BQB8_9MICO|nr:NAD(P)H-binding protein [Pseudoclavibacter chungangensis]KAB1655986.1 NAD(P)H-binding protein [Pseudoclavibacter chungangensis]NYJ66433.1 putative NADH-flavin reductase [Pseudoclavibacter chungangensis]